MDRALKACGFAAALLLAAPASAQQLLPNGQQQFTDSNGVPIAGGSVFFYVPSTTTAKLTYQDQGETTPNSNPVLLDSAGRGTVWGDGLYREVVYDQFGNLIWDQLTGSEVDGEVSGFGTRTTVTAASTTDLTQSPGHNLLITGTTTIISFGTTAKTTSPIYIVQFASSLTLTYNASTMLLPGSANIQTRAGDFAQVQYLGLGAWRVVSYLRGNGQALSGVGTAAVVASGATVDLGASGANLVQVSGTAGISSFGSSASLVSPLYYVEFLGALTLTHNATSLILPGGVNISTAAGDFALALYLGSGNWRVLNYSKASGSGGGGFLGLTIYTSGSGTYTTPAGAKTLLVETIGSGGGSGGVATMDGSHMGASTGGGGGAVCYNNITSPAATYAYVVGAGGTAGSSAGGDGGTGTATTFGAGITAGAGLGGDGDPNGVNAFPTNNEGNVDPVTGGACTGGDLAIPGGRSGAPILYSLSLATNSAGGSAGAFSPGPGNWAVLGELVNGQNYGGGAGGTMITGVAGIVGGAGAGGLILVWAYS